MSRWRKGLQISMVAALFVLFAFYLAQSPPPRAPLSALPGAPAQQEEPEQGDNLFMPFVQNHNDGQVAAKREPVEQEATAEPAPTAEPLPTPTPIVLPTPEIHTFAEESRGALIRVGDKEVQLPEDAYIESMIITVLPSHRYRDNPIKPPVAVLRRNAIVVGVELATGRTFLTSTVEDARREFQFLFDVVGEEMIVPIPADERVPDPTPAPTEVATSVPQEPTPEMGETPVFYTFAEETRGEIITILDKDIQLPEDAYIFGVMTGVSPDPNVLNPPIAPLTILKRKDATVSVENSTGRIFLWMPEDVARREFDFLIQALGEDKIFVPEYQIPPNPQLEVTDAPQPQPENTNVPQ